MKILETKSRKEEVPRNAFKKLEAVTSSTYQFDEHCMWIGATSRGDKQVYLLLSPVTMPLCARGLAHWCLRYSSLYITFTVAELCVVFRWTFRRDAEQEP